MISIMEIKKTNLIRLPLCQYCHKEIKYVCSRDVFNLEGVYFHLQCLNNLIKHPFK